jgi:hypothetical protein
METTGYLEVPVGHGWEAWISSDDRGWIVEFVRYTHPACVLLASRPRPLGATVFPDPPIALRAVRSVLFDDADGPTALHERAPR